jgi:hypothetical protein
MIPFQQNVHSIFPSLLELRMLIDMSRNTFHPQKIQDWSVTVSCNFFSFTYPCTSLYISHIAVSIAPWSYLQALLL